MSLSDPDIQLIRPPAVESFRFATTSITLPIGLAYISSSLKKHGFKVEIKSPTFHEMYIQEGEQITLRYLLDL